ncbi:hypothetical protein [Streptomyces sp. NPDC093094]|uniref:hypothetical protein n=1 Tax=Streptomyces sp. NPDC093094 TaxID=3366026 RepID=UPI00381A3C8A
MSTTRRLLGTGPATPAPPAPTQGPARLLPAERAAAGEHQEHDDPHAQAARGPVPERRPLGVPTGNTGEQVP